MTVNFNGESPEKWLVVINPHLNDVHQRVPNQNLYPCIYIYISCAHVYVQTITIAP